MRGYNYQSHTGETIIFVYFRFIKNKDINKLIDLFADDAIIYEPFSKTGDTDGLQGRTAIESLLNTVIMANSGLNHQIEIIKSDRKVCNNNDQITTNVTFERGGKVKAKFVFEFSSESVNFHKQKDSVFTNRVHQVEFNLTIGSMQSLSLMSILFHYIRMEGLFVLTVLHFKNIV